MTERERQASDMLKTIAREIKKLLPEGMGFALLAYEFGDENPDKKMLYVSNSNRENVMLAMTEFLQKHIENPDIFGKDVD